MGLKFDSDVENTKFEDYRELLPKKNASFDEYIRNLPINDNCPNHILNVFDCLDDINYVKSILRIGEELGSSIDLWFLKLNHLMMIINIQKIILIVLVNITKIYLKRKIRFHSNKGIKDTISLVNIAALFISDINFAVLSEEMEKNKIKHLFANKNILVLDNKKLFKLNDREFPKSLFSEKLKKAERNEKRKILYLSSGSTGNPKLIENNSKSAFLCHKKVINLFKIDNNLKNILCFHSNSFVISLNYVLLGLLCDLELITIYKGGPLKLISSIKKIGTNSIIISVPSFWEKLVLIIAGQLLRLIQ